MNAPRIFLLSLTLTLLMLLSPANLHAVDCTQCPRDISEKLFGALQRPGNAGTEFYLTFLPCYVQGGAENRLMIYVAATSRTRVRVEIEGRGYVQEQYSSPNDIIAFVLDPGSGQAYSKLPQDEAPVEQVYRLAGIHITAGAPVVVYGVTRFSYTSDSFLGVPVQCLGKEYIVSSMADMSKMYSGFSLPSEVAVVGVYPGTQVSFTCGGPDPTVSVGGLRPGKTTSFTLNPGDVWVISNSKDSKEGDFSGSRIVSSKPVGVLSGNQCANVPTPIRWCDFISEMEMPTSLWGRHYLIPRYSNRKFGYYMKVQAAKANTHVDYNSSFWRLIQTSGGQEGTGWIYQRVDLDANNVVQLDADCPIDVMVFNPGQEDDNVITDPFQMVVVPVEQFQRYSVFCTPGLKGGAGFETNYMGIVFQLDTLTGTMPKDLEFATQVNGKLVWRQLSLTFGPGIASRDIYKGKVNGRRYAFKECILGAGSVYAIRCGTPFGCYLYGGSAYDSYGHPATGALVSPMGCDSIPPVVTYKIECDGSVGVVTKATVNDMPNDDAIRSNLSTIFLDPDSSSNYTLTYQPFVPGETRQTSWSLTVDDPEQDAIARVIFTDRAGNDTAITIRYFATKLSMSSDLNFAVMKKGDTLIKSIDLINNTNRAQHITKLVLRSSMMQTSQNGVFAIVGPALPFDLDPGAHQQIQVRCICNGDALVKDSIGVGTDCFFKIKRLLSVQSAKPVIAVSDIDFGTQLVNTASAPIPFTVASTGTVRLIVSAHSGVQPDESVFDISDLTNAGIDAAHPLALQDKSTAPNTKSFNVVFKPTTIKSYTAQIVFSSDATTVDSICVLKGVAVGAGLHVNAVDYGRRRIKRGPYTSDRQAQTTEIILRNSGNSDVKISRAEIITLSNNPSAFTTATGSALDLSAFNNILISAGSEYRRSIAYTPQTCSYDSVLINFVNDSPDTAVFVARGIGVIPHSETVDLAFGNYNLLSETGPRALPFFVRNLDTTTTPRWEFFDTLHISDIVDSSASGQQDIDISGAYSTLGFGYDKPSMNLPLVLAPGAQSLVTNGMFKPSTIVASVKAALHTVSDAEVEAVSNWSGSASGSVPSMSLSPLHFSPCAGETQILSTTLTNTSKDSISLEVPLELHFENGQLNSFRIVSQPSATIEKGQSAKIEIEYLAPLTAQSESVDLIVKAQSRGQVIYDTLHITTLVSRPLSSLQAAVINGEAIHETQQYFDYGIRLTTALDAARVQALSMRMSFNPSLIAVERQSGTNAVNVFVNAAGAAAGWTAQGDYTFIDETHAEIAIRLSGTSALMGGTGEELFHLRFQLLVAPSTLSQMNARINVGLDQVQAFYDEAMLRLNRCPDIQPIAGSINAYEVCARDIRMVSISTTQTQVLSTYPHPVGAAGSTIDISLAFESPTRLELVNSIGEVVEVLLDQSLHAGRYSLKFVPGRLSDGVYTLRLFGDGSVRTYPIVVAR